MTDRRSPLREARAESAAARIVWRHRSGAIRGLLLAFCGTVLVFAFLLAFVLGFSSRREASDVSSALDTGSIDTRSESMTAPLASNAADQDATVRRTITRAFGSARVTVDRSIVSSPWPVSKAGGKSTSGAPSVVFLAASAALLGSVQESAHHAAAAGLASVAIDAAGARALHVTAGDDIVVHLDRGETTLAVTSVWTARNPLDLDWSGIGPQAQGASARLLLSPAAFATLGIERNAIWAVGPSHGTTPNQLDDLQRGFDRVGSAVMAAAPENSALTVTGGGKATVTTVIDSLAASRAVLPAPLAILAIAAIVALVLVVQLIAAVRQNEMRMLRARGALVATIARVAAWEAGSLSLLAALAGALLAQLLLLPVAGPPVDPAEPAIAPLVVFAVATLILAGSTVWSAATVSGGAGPDATRGRSAISGSAAALAVVAAALNTWRLLVYGTASPTAHPDPVGALAPAFVLLAFAVLCLVAIGPAALFVARRIPRTSGATATMAARQVSRNVALFAGPAALVSLAAGGLFLAGGYTATLQGLQSSSAHVTNGADVRAVYPDRVVVGSSADLLGLAPYRRLAGVTDVTPVVQTSTQVGDSTVSVVALNRDSLGALVSVEPGIVDTSKIAAELGGPAPELPGIAVAANSTAITAQVSAVSATGSSGSTATVTLWLANQEGQLVPVALRAIPVEPASDPGGQPVSVRMPAGGPWAVVATDVDFDAQHAMTQVRFHLALPTRTAATSLAWRPVPTVFGASFAAVKEHDGSIAAERSAMPRSSNGDTIVRLMPGRSSAIPVVINQQLAAALGTAQGNTATFQGTWSTFRGVVEGIVPVIPGAASGPGAIADLAAYDAAALRSSVEVPAVNQVWANGPGTATALSRFATVAGADAVVTAAATAEGDRFTGVSLVALWLGAGGAAAFSIIALAGAVAALGRRRDDEVAVLRAMGFSARQQSRGRLVEYAGVVVYAAVVGAIGGLVAVALFAAPLSLISVPSASLGIPVPVQMALALLLPALALLLVMAALVVAVAASRIFAHASNATLRGQV